jgi:hypothetical protein
VLINIQVLKIRSLMWKANEANPNMLGHGVKKSNVAHGHESQTDHSKIDALLN